jgi:hypothetical protein
MRFMTPVLTAACFCSWLEVAPTRVAAQTTSVTAPQQADECNVVRKRGKGKTETAPCTSVFVTVPASPPPPPPVDPCKIGGFHFWSWLKCNYGAVGAVASGISALIALWIGSMAFLLNRNIRKGQVAHEQMRMLLEIDGALVDRPELWAAHGTTYLEVRFPSKEIDKKVEDFRNANQADKPKKAEAIAEALCANPTATRIAELRQLAFTTRYFNFFEILFANYRKKHWWSRDPEKNEKWKAWRAYIVDFFTDNEYARNEWRKFAAKHIYSASFEKFMVEIVPKVEGGSSSSPSP